jgi:hypothetical protein
MYLQKVIRKENLEKNHSFVGILLATDEKCKNRIRIRKSVVRIRIRTKMSRPQHWCLVAYFDSYYFFICMSAHNFTTAPICDLTFETAREFVLFIKIRVFMHNCNKKLYYKIDVLVITNNASLLNELAIFCTNFAVNWLVFVKKFTNSLADEHITSLTLGHTLAKSVYCYYIS